MHEYEKTLKYKSEVYQRNFLDFVCGSPTSTKASNQDVETKIKPCGTTQKEEVQTKEPQDLKGRIAQEENVQIEKPQDLKGGD